jgi:methionyl-tRNA synthetase
MKIFIGGAWPYANNSLHIGHLAALLPGDVLARYFRMAGAQVIYISGTDSHGTPITLRAKKENISPEEIALKYHNEFEECFSKLGFTYDLYTKTCDDYHKKAVGEYFELIYRNGFIHKKSEEQDFCEACDTFLSDREIEGICPQCGGAAKGDQCDQCLTTLNAKELLNKKCKNCGENTKSKENIHLYFELSRFQNEIEKLVEEKKLIWRTNAVNETAKYLKNGLVDRAASRQLTWGVDIPVDGYEDKKIYVWIEAVLGYLTAGKRYAESKGIDFDEFMIKKNDNELKTYYVHGKDNIPFHTIIFPALLLSIKKDYQLPDYILSCEYVNMNNEKISKSKGNGIIIKDLIDEYEADTIRYYTIINGPEKKDVNFSYDELELKHNKHLVGEYGNFANRNLAFLVKKFDGIIPDGLMDNSIMELIDEMYIEVGNFIEKGEFKNAMEKVFALVQAANKYYDDKKPWIQVKEAIEDFNNTTYTCINLIANIANILEPFMPNSSKKLKKMLKIENYNEWKSITVPQNTKLNDVKVLFNKIEKV